MKMHVYSLQWSPQTLKVQKQQKTLQPSSMSFGETNGNICTVLLGNIKKKTTGSQQGKPKFTTTYFLKLKDKIESL